jgi:starvation-inducible outer membrane lipoprotein
MNLITLSLLLCVCITVHGCSTIPQEANDEDLVIRNAKAEVSNFSGRMKLTVESKIRDGDHWKITIWTLPRKPGGFYVVEIDDAGHVVCVKAGS